MTTKRNRFSTIVIQMPDSESDREFVRSCIDQLKPFITAMSLQDEISLNERIEAHEDVPDYVVEQLREEMRVAELG